MSEILNTIGTLVTVVALTMAMIVLPHLFVKILAGAGLVYVMYYHDEYMKEVGRRDEREKQARDAERKDVVDWLGTNKREE